jgi:hypothetical protein
MKHNPRKSLDNVSKYDYCQRRIVTIGFGTYLPHLHFQRKGLFQSSLKIKRRLYLRLPTLSEAPGMFCQCNAKLSA